MKVIDLLNKMANGEEVPKKIRFDNTYWNRICGEKYTYYVNDNDSDLFIYFFRKNLTFSLNDEVEIIEPQEHKIPEKIEYHQVRRNEVEVDYIEDEIVKHFCLNKKQRYFADKINEILDYLEVNNG